MNPLSGHTGAMELIRSSAALVVLIACSIVVLTVTLERAWRYFHSRARLPQLREGLRLALKTGSADDAFAVCRQYPSPAANVAVAGLANRHLPLREMDEVMAAAAAGERLILEKRLWLLSTIGHLSPFIGLFGTVVGIMKAFQDLAAAGGGGPSVVAAGIAEALVTTAAGLAVAIPSVALHNWLTRRVRTFVTEMEIMAAYLVAMLAEEKTGTAALPGSLHGRNGAKRVADRPAPTETLAPAA